MDTYPKRVADNILPLSVSNNLPAAFDEWRFTERTHDHGDTIAQCHLCDKKEIRYHFEIANRFTAHHLWVGSHCILQFDLPVYEGEHRLSLEEAKAKLNKLTEKMQLEACLRALRALASSEANDILQKALEYYERNKKLTPKFAFVVFWRLRTHQIDHNPSFFNITLNKKRFKNDLREMETSRVHFFWSALTASQRKTAIEMGHQPPATT